nr:methyltransferase domain-containing protein [uncultured Faecalimonas sp.]
MKKEYTIHEVAALFNITSNKIRYYERKGLLTPTRQLENGYRKFCEKDIQRLGTVLMYRSIGCSIDAIRTILESEERETCLHHIHNQWNAVNHEIHRLFQLRKILEQIIDTVYEEHDLEEAEAKASQLLAENLKFLDLHEKWEDRWNFDGWARSYDESVRKNSGALNFYQNYEVLLQKVYASGSTWKNGKSEILEIGVGTGNLAEKFLNSGHRIIGIDQSREMLNVAKEKLPKLKVRMGDFLNIPYEKQSFDVIVSTYAFHHLNEKEKSEAMKEMFRVLKTDGKIILGDLMFESKETENEFLQTLTPEELEEVQDEYYSHIDTLRLFVQKYGKRLVYERIDSLNYIVEIY